MSPENLKRAERALGVLDTYCEIDGQSRAEYIRRRVNFGTGEVGPQPLLVAETGEEVLGDLLADLEHLADLLGVDWTAALERGRFHHDNEED